MIPRHSRLHQPAVGLLPRRYLIGGRRVTPRITQRPFVLGRCPASDTHGGRTRQAALWARGTPGAAPALLLRRLPGEARTERKGRLARCRSSAMLFPVHAVDSGGQCVCVHRLIPHSQRAVNFLIVLERARRDCTLLGIVSHSGSQICCAVKSAFARI